MIVVDTYDAVYVFERVINKLHAFSRDVKAAKWELSSKLLGPPEVSDTPRIGQDGRPA